MRYLRQVAAGLDTGPLLAELAAQPALWRELTFRQAFPGSAHRDTECIFLRWCTEAVDPAAVFFSTEAVDYPALAALPAAQPLIDALLAAVDAEALGRVLLVNLQPQGEITPHIDEGAYADYYDRFHIALASEPGNAFTVGAETVHMAPGSAWWFNHKREHTVRNGSAVPRLHLIVDAVAPTYRALRNLDGGADGR